MVMGIVSLGYGLKGDACPDVCSQFTTLSRTALELAREWRSWQSESHWDFSTSAASTSEPEAISGELTRKPAHDPHRV